MSVDADGATGLLGAWRVRTLPKAVLCGLAGITQPLANVPFYLPGAKKHCG